MRTTSTLVIVLLSALAAQAQQPGADPAAREALQRATAEDHRDMLAQLGIRALRPGPSGTETAPNHANYDEALANPYPDLPDPLTLKNGRRVTTAEAWVTQRRAEIVEDFDRDVLGRVPGNLPAVTWQVTKVEEWNLAGRRVVGRALVSVTWTTAPIRRLTSTCR